MEDFQADLLKKQEYSGTTLTLTNDYLGSVQYLNGSSQFAATGEGRVYNNAGTFRYDYFMKDQVGNIRMTFTANGTGVTVLQRDEYYPFGNTFDSYLGSGGANTYKFNGMEFEENNLNTFDFHARMYDPQIGRSFQPDPHADAYASKSPFSFLANNSISITDPTGMDEYDDGNGSGGGFSGSATSNINTEGWNLNTGYSSVSQSGRGFGGYHYDPVRGYTRNGIPVSFAEVLGFIKPYSYSLTFSTAMGFKDDACSEGGCIKGPNGESILTDYIDVSAPQLTQGDWWEHLIGPALLSLASPTPKRFIAANSSQTSAVLSEVLSKVFPQKIASEAKFYFADDQF